MSQQTVLEKVFKQAYETAIWKDTLLRLFPKANFFRTPEIMELTESKAEDAQQIVRYGSVELADGKTLDLYEVRLQDGINITRNRVGLRNLLHNYVISGLVDGIIATYYNPNSADWRLSFISKNAYWDDEQGIVKAETHPKRYTFVLGKNESIKTVIQRIEPLINSVEKGKQIQLEDLLKAFSVQKISKEFFKSYKENYQAFSEFLGSTKTRALFIPDREDLTAKEQEDETNRNISNFAKKLLGRVVFLYFLQKKGWLGVPKDLDWGNGKRDFVAQLFSNTENRLNFYNQSLVPLFFETLNKKRTDHLFKLTQTKVPFLNGGLFDPIPNEPTTIQFREDLFENLFNFFDGYNFTIDENSPDDLDIGIDPEMLGLIFENLLEENRSKTGAFYTPKEVVHYMCKESLSLYLQKKLASNINKEELKIIDAFVKQTDNSTPALIKTHADDIQNHLNRLKICDPAIGSGAFPLGLLFEILRIRKEIFPHLSKQKNFNYRDEKLNIMRNNIYGVDIDGGAVDIARLRFWLSLIVDEDEPRPLPNLDYKIMQGDSMMESFEGIDLSNVKNTPRNVKVYEPETDLFGKYTKPQLSINSMPFDTESIEEKIKDFFKIEDSDAKKKKHADIDNEVIKHIETRCDAYRLELFAVVQKAKAKYESARSNLRTDAQFERFQKSKEAKDLDKWHKKLADLDRIDERLHLMVNQNERPYFLWHLFFKDVFDEGGFDIVIGNPPYGVSFTEELKDEYKLASKDSYGVFMAHAMHKLMKPNATCSFIVSDTWLTIKSHLPLRKQILEKQLHKVIRLPGDTFGATVNTCIYIQSNSNATLTEKTEEQKSLLVADLTNLSPQKRLPEFRDVLFNLEKYTGIYTPDFAVYQYPQQLISTNSNNPIFVASPKLFALMNDTTCTSIKQNEGTNEELTIRQIELNNKTVELVRFGDIADIKVGLQTGDNQYYLYQNPNARGTYKDINLFKQFLLSNDDLNIIRNNEPVRLKVIENGIHQNKDESDFDADCWFGGRYIVPYDKGGESDTDNGWLPNYYVPTNYFIDWSTLSVSRLKAFTVAQRITEYKENKTIKSHYNTTPCAVIRSKETYFKKGISFSRTGVYAPTFRQNSFSIYDTEGSTVFFNDFFEAENYIGVLCSKLNKYLLKNFLGHTVHTQVDELKENPLIYNSISDATYFESLISNQKLNQRYDYQSNEQKQIDALVYDAYGLNQEDINEVETWYARRYPKMAKYADIVPLSKEIAEVEEAIIAESLYAKKVKEVIALGESKRAEFKSTLRYCLKQNSPQTYVEHSVLKTIGAFLNSYGGTLLVGVDDDGNILGLQNDYSTFGKNKNQQDEWVKHFDNICSYAFGNVPASNVELNFAIIDDKQVAIIEVKSSSKEVFLKNKTEKDRKEFFIRRNGSTIMLDAEEMMGYVKERWG